VIRHNGRGDLVIGKLRPPQTGDALIAKLAAYLAGAKVPTRISDNVEGELWWKLILNCAYNAVSALGRSRYGPMMAMPEIRQVMSEAVREIIALAKAKGVQAAIPDPVDAGQPHAPCVGEAVGAGADFVMARARLCAPERFQQIGTRSNSLRTGKITGNFRTF
jgi:hypothetical protein